MTTFVLIHGAGDSGWAWRLLEAALRALGHHTVAPDLPSEDETYGLVDYADSVVEAAAGPPDPDDVVVVGHSFGGFTAPLVADRMNARQLVLLAAMVPSPGESPDDWWANTGYADAVRSQAALDGGATGNPDPMVSFYNGVPEPLAREAERRGRDQAAGPMGADWPLARWPDVPTRFLLGRDDHFFPADFFRRQVPERLGLTPEEVPGGHCMMLSHPHELAEALLTGIA